MSRPAIIVDGIGKSYRIGLKEEKYPTFREAMVHAVKAPVRRFQTLGERSTEADTFWALRHIDFEVQPGEVVGIIGRNGAGKSTLLKILSRITEPTEGLVRLRGRVASLLEVGTGFHPELTGRENIYLNGSILGMKRAEIDRKFDEIVAFAEIEKFLDTPVKRYSSGMYVRLAFAVAAHLEPEILIVDEVLAVGDTAFQKKCLGKMKDVTREGRTVLFVSHNMNAVSQLCQTAILLKNGHIAIQGSVMSVLAAYSNQNVPTLVDDLSKHPGREPASQKIFQGFEMLDSLEGSTRSFSPLARVTLRIMLDSGYPIPSPRISAGINNWRGDRVFAIATYLGRSLLPTVFGAQVVVATFDLPALMPGRYSIDLGITDADLGFLDAIYSAAAFDIIPSNYLGTTQDYFDQMGHVMVRSEWSTL